LSDPISLITSIITSAILGIFSLQGIKPELDKNKIKEKKEKDAPETENVTPNVDESDITEETFEDPQTEDNELWHHQYDSRWDNDIYLDLDGSTVENKSDYLEWAAAQFGFKEYETVTYTNEKGEIVTEGANITPFGEYCGLNGDGTVEGMKRAPWCAMFVSWCLEMSGNTVLHKSYNAVGFKEQAIEKEIWHETKSGYVPEPGDIFIIEYGDKTGHVGFVNSVTLNEDGSYTITTIEGNSSDQVNTRTISSTEFASKKITGFISMDRASSTGETDPISGLGSGNDSDKTN
jgi:hypothetical protein